VKRRIKKKDFNLKHDVVECLTENSMAFIRMRTIPTVRPPLVEKISELSRIEGRRVVSETGPHGR
jgi:hypothetical protein